MARSDSHEHGGHEDGHGRGHGHSHGAKEMPDSYLAWAVVINVVLTVAQVVGGILSGSLALIADALHNFSDAGSLLIAWFARRIGRRPADASMTFGYARAEIVAALINFTTLILIGLYLGYEAVMRIVEPQDVQGWTMVIVAGIALVVDAATAALTYAGSRRSMNIKAAFLHNVADALASVAVIVGGVVIIFYDWRLIDPILTLAIAAYVLWHGLSEIGGAIRILMLGAPEEMDASEIVSAMQRVEGVSDVHHVHLWRFDEKRVSLEAHVALAERAADAGAIKGRIRRLLEDEFGVGHVTLETEIPGERCAGAGGVAG